MNKTTDSSGILGSSNISGVGYAVGISIGILLLITTITLTSYFCTRKQAPTAPATRRNTPNFLGPQHSIVDLGLDEATILSYPKLLYSEAKLRKSDSTATCCSICLADYKGTDMLRVLPDCRHQFHLKCIDPWLRLHPSCPVCRTSPIPTPLSTPLAEVVPLASRQDFAVSIEIESISSKLVLLLSLSLSLLYALTDACNVRNCDKKADYDVKVKRVEISPNPIARGQPAIFSIAATTGQAISGGILVIDVSYFGWHIHSETHDLCGETSCPVSIGDFVVGHTQVLPRFTPPGSCSLKMKMHDGNKHELTCIGFGFDIGFISSVADS